MTDDLDKPGVVVHDKLIGGPAHGQSITVPLQFKTVQVMIGFQTRAEYWQRTFLFGGREHRAWCWPSLPEDELLDRAQEAFACAS